MFNGIFLEYTIMSIVIGPLFTFNAKQPNIKFSKLNIIHRGVN